MIKPLLTAIEKGWIPDPIIRLGIRKLIQQRIQEDIPQTVDRAQAKTWEHVQALKNSAIAIETKKANEQHYELPPEFFKLCLGNRRKYSACVWTDTTQDLNQAEINSLEQIVERLQVQDGHKILELGCGWGSLTLFMAEKFPKSPITAVSNSAPQRLHIQSECQKRGLTNVNIITADINQLKLAESFDRVVSIEMFEHMRNYQALFEKVSSWMNSGALLFIHIFTHKSVPYFFETDGDHNWMGRYFFSGGQMPSNDLLLYFAAGLEPVGHWTLDGTHYAKTSEAWLVNMDRNRAEILKIFATTYPGQVTLWWNRWRIFYLSVAELFNYRNGQEWCVTHHLFKKP